MNVRTMIWLGYWLTFTSVAALSAGLTLFTGNENEISGWCAKTFLHERQIPLAIYKWDAFDPFLPKNSPNWMPFFGSPVDLVFIAANRRNRATTPIKFRSSVKTIEQWEAEILSIDPKLAMLAHLKDNLIMAKKDLKRRATWVRIVPDVKSTTGTAIEIGRNFLTSDVFESDLLHHNFVTAARQRLLIGMVLLIADPYPGTPIFPEEMTEVSALAKKNPEAISFEIIKLSEGIDGQQPIIFRYRPERQNIKPADFQGDGAA